MCGLVPHIAPILSCACPSCAASALQLEFQQLLVRPLHPPPCCELFNGPTFSHADVPASGRSARVSRKQREQPPNPFHPDLCGARCVLHWLTHPVPARPSEEAAKFTKTGPNRGRQWSVEKNLQPTDGRCEQYTHKYSRYRVAHSTITSHHVRPWLKSWKARGLRISVALK